MLPPNEDRLRPSSRSANVFSKVTKLRSRPSSAASSPTVVTPPSTDLEPLPVLDSFVYFTALPLELQAYIFTFLPARILNKTIGRTCRQYRDLAESYTRRRILDFMRPLSWDVRSTADDFITKGPRRPTNVLVFEAQRPIDTLTTKHTLYFSHFSRTEAGDGHRAGGSGSSTLAHFSFSPVEAPLERRDQSADSMASSGSDLGGSSSEASGSSLLFPGAPSLPTSILQARYPNVHADDQSRLNPRSVTSSVSIPSRSNASTPRADDRRRPFTDVSTPTEWRESSSRVAAHLVADNDESMESTEEMTRAPPSARENAAHQGRAYEGFDASEPQLSGHWSEPVASSAAALDNNNISTTHGGRDGQDGEAAARRGKQRQRPTYRFQLDPLDSFETWILSLKLQRRSDTTGLLKTLDSASTARPMRWEKPVAEGLDRIFREWFSPASQLSGGSRSLGQPDDGALYRASLLASLGSTYYSSSASAATSTTSSAMDLASDEPIQGGKMADPSEEEEQPEARVLEFDGTSCTLQIQPHTMPFNSHPALTALSSHHYLSSMSLSSQLQASLTSRVEFTFHCESLTINAARLLNALEDVERDVQRATEAARQRGAHILSGSSGGTAWAYSTNARDDASATPPVSNPPRWTDSSADGRVSVLVFGAARD